MDWCMDNRVAGAADALTAHVLAHLGRHASGAAMAELARPVVATALAERPPGCHWVSLDWERPRCRLLLRSVSEAELAGDPLAPGVTAAHLVAPDLHRRHGGVPAMALHLDVTRPHEPDLDPGPVAGAAPVDGPGPVAGLVAQELIAGRDPAEAAARAGATAAATAGPAEGPGADLASAAAAFVAMERAIGGDFHVVLEEPGRVVLANRRCPFGPAAPAALCRFTSAAAGSLAARATGSAAVVLDERIALGDHQCRLVLADEDGAGAAAHRYRWPPSGAGTAGAPADPRPSTDRPPGSVGTAAHPADGFRVTLSLQLPRDRLSVPVTRHLVSAAMHEVGVLPDDAAAVALAVTEACANVVDHSGPGDAYEVAITIEPSHCHIRVVDIGRGFDHGHLTPPEMAAVDAEHGRGVALMHALVDQVRFESAPERGTVVHLVKRLHFDDGAPARRLLGEGAS